MLKERQQQLKAALSSYGHTLLPLIAPFFLQLSSSVFLLGRIPFFMSVGPALGLLISYLFGPVGFFTSAFVWGSYLFIAHSELLLEGSTIFFLCSSLISWWLSTLCSEQYQQKIVDLEEMIAAIFHKNNELEKHAKEALVTLREERKQAVSEHQELADEIKSLKAELSSHRHHLSLAWQESSSLKEEADRERIKLTASLEGAQSQSLFYLQQKQQAEALLQEIKQQLQDQIKQREEKQDEFLEQFRLFQDKTDQLKREIEEKNRRIQDISAELVLVKNQCDELQLSSTVEARQQQEGDSTSSHFEELYRQLKQQFEEKSQTLSETRKHLFSMEHELLIMKKKEEESLLEENSHETGLIATIGLLVEECHDMQQQVTVLEEILTCVQEKKKSPRGKKESHAAVDKLIDSARIVQDSLFSL